MVDASLVSIVAVDGCAKFSCWKLILTGDFGDCPRRESSGSGTRGNCFSPRMLCGEDGFERGFRRMETEAFGGGVVSTAAIANGTRVVSLRLSASDQLSELFSMLLASRN